MILIFEHGVPSPDNRTQISMTKIIIGIYGVHLRVDCQYSRSLFAQ